VALINEEAAKAWWSGGPGQAIGKRIKLGTAGGDGPWVTVVGVTRSFAASGRYQFPLPRRPAVIVATPPSGGGPRYASLLVRVSGNPHQFVPPLQAAAERANASLIFSGPSVAESIRRRAETYEPNLFLFNLFAGIGVILVAVGIVGVVLQVAARHTREIGVRIALGAPRTSILAVVAKRGFLLGVGGALLGLVLSLWFVRLLVLPVAGGPVDPVVLAGVSLGFVGLITAACYFPARRATRIDPLRALRSE
jgi:hypothetical protein